MGAEKSEGNSFFCPHISALASGFTFSRKVMPGQSPACQKQFPKSVSCGPQMTATPCLVSGNSFLKLVQWQKHGGRKIRRKFIFLPPYFCPRLRFYFLKEGYARAITCLPKAISEKCVLWPAEHCVPLPSYSKFLFPICSLPP